MRNHVRQLNSWSVREGCWLVNMVNTYYSKVPNRCAAVCVCACHASFHTEGFAFLPACLCIYCCVFIQACALVHETRVYFHTGAMNHFAENLSLISHLRFLFTLVGAPFQPLSLILHSSQSSARSRSHLRWATRQGIRSRRRQNSSPSPVFMDCEIDLKQGQQRFGLASATRATLFSCRGGEQWVALVSDQSHPTVALGSTGP